MRIRTYRLRKMVEKELQVIKSKDRSATVVIIMEAIILQIAMQYDGIQSYKWNLGQLRIAEH